LEASLSSLRRPFALRQKKEQEIRTEMRRLKMEMHALEEACDADASFIMKCPLSCRGYLDGNYHCRLCEGTVCRHCWQYLCDNHVCAPDDCATVTAILRDSKPCPHCGFRVSRTDGCDQMFCVNCLTAWNWATNQVEMGDIHNPVYFEMLKSDQIHHPRHLSLQGVCGPLIPLATVVDMIRNAHVDDSVSQHVLSLYLQMAQLRTMFLPRFNDVVDRDPIIVAFLAGFTTEHQYLNELFVHHEKKQRLLEEQQVLTTFIEAGEDLFRMMTADSVQDTVQLLFSLRQVAFDAFHEVAQLYLHSGWIRLTDIIPEEEDEPALRWEDLAEDVAFAVERVDVEVEADQDSVSVASEVDSDWEPPRARRPHHGFVLEDSEAESDSSSEVSSLSTDTMSDDSSELSESSEETSTYCSSEPEETIAMEPMEVVS